MKPLIVSFALILAVMAVGCKKDDSQGPGQPKPINLPSKGAEVIAKSNEFGIDLFRITALQEEQNLMLSPLSASTALTMLLNGCNMATYDQIRDMLGYDGLTLEEINAAYNSLVTQLLAVDPGVELALANAVWYRRDFTVKAPFLEAMSQSYDAEIEGLDFTAPSALNTINGWASDNTNGKIPQVLDQIDPQAVMFLMNALYFKGKWTYKFKETEDGSFYLDDGTEVSVTYMKRTLPVKTFSGMTSIAAELPYGDQNFAMVVIVPNGTLAEYTEAFSNTEWSTIIAGIDAIEEAPEVNLFMPRFKFSYEKFLNDQLQALGMTDAFDPSLADLSSIADNDLYVDFVKQNTFVEVNEEGTEAAAVTTIGINVTSFPPEPGTFRVDKPFIFAIRERTTNTLLFIGKVELPEE